MTSEVSEKEDQNRQQDISQEPQQEIVSKEENTQILVKNLPESATEELLRKNLDKFGKILQVKIDQDINGNATGEAILEFETKQEKDLALNSNEEIEIDGKKIEINDPTNKGLTLFVGNIPYTSKEADVIEFFSECGKIELKFFYFNGSFKGYAYVTFQDENKVEIALKKDGEKLGGREIKIERLKSRNFIQAPRVGGRRGGYRGRGRAPPSFGHFDRERKEDYFRERRERDRYRDWDRGRPYNRIRDRGDRDRDWNRENRDRRERSRDRSREYNRMRDRGERDRNDRERERHREYEREREERDRGDRDRNDRERENERHREYERDRSNRDRERRHSNYEQDKW